MNDNTKAALVGKIAWEDGCYIVSASSRICENGNTSCTMKHIPPDMSLPENYCQALENIASFGVWSPEITHDFALGGFWECDFENYYTGEWLGRGKFTGKTMAEAIFVALVALYDHICEEQEK